MILYIFLQFFLYETTLSISLSSYPDAIIRISLFSLILISSEEHPGIIMTSFTKLENLVSLLSLYWKGSEYIIQSVNKKEQIYMCIQASSHHSGMYGTPFPCDFVESVIKEPWQSVSVKKMLAKYKYK